MMLPIIILLVLLAVLAAGLWDAGLGGWFCIAAIAFAYPILLLTAAITGIAWLLQHSGVPLL